MKSLLEGFKELKGYLKERREKREEEENKYYNCKYEDLVDFMFSNQIINCIDMCEYDIEVIMEARYYYESGMPFLPKIKKLMYGRGLLSQEQCKFMEDLIKRDEVEYKFKDGAIDKEFYDYKMKLYRNLTRDEFDKLPMREHVILRKRTEVK